MGCDDPSVKAAFSDQLDGTLIALRGRYVLAGKVTNLQVDAIPFFVNGIPALLSLADRDAILVRAGLTAAPVSFAATPWLCSKPSDDGCNYVTAPPAFEIKDPNDPNEQTVLLTIAVERGFMGVDVAVRGQSYRVFNTHLEQRLLGEGLLDTRILQVGQAYELLAAAQGTWDPTRTLIVVGDINSAPGDTIPVPPYPPVLPSPPFPAGLPMLAPYQVFTQIGGFTDAWTLRRHAPDEGYSCCQAENLLNRRSELYERIDMIFSLTPPSRVLDMKLLGTNKGDKTRPPGNGGLWQSDHAAVAAKLKFD
jgi:endonuclease/exonuclease/phosphatase family metal-dependent hydrolase